MLRRTLFKAGAGVLVGGLCLAIEPLRAALATRQNTIAVTIDTGRNTGISSCSPGMTISDTSLFYPWGNNDQMAVSSAESLIQKGMQFLNIQMMGWGCDDPWPDPTQPGPTNWTTLDEKLQIVLDTGRTPVLTLCEAPWWMKGQLNGDGSTTLLTSADEWSDIAYTSRILDNKMSAWLTLVQDVARRYLVAPYNVRYFQVWNELKGYYNPITNNWDMSTSAGDPGGNHARHGYTYMYNQVYTALKNIAQSLGIAPSTVHVGGPYVVMDTWSSTENSNPSNWTTAYGNYDQRTLDAVTYWLQNKAGAEFITVDGSNVNDDGMNITDEFTASQKFGDVVTWIRSLDNSQYPGAATLPIWFAEWYADPYSNVTDAFNNAVKAYAMVKYLKAGGAVLLEWGGTGDGTDAGGLWTPTTVGGGQPLVWYYSYQALHDDFAPGTHLCAATSSSSSIEVLASPTKTLLINKTNTTLLVTVNSASVTLYPYQVKIMNTPV